MATHSYSKIVDKAKSVKKNVENNYKLGEDSKWSYYFAKAIITPKKNITKITFDKAPKPSGTHISNQIKKADYVNVAKYLISFVEKRNRLPNYIQWGNYRIRVRDYTYLFARIVVWYYEKKSLPNYANINTKCWIKPSEPYLVVYDYFVSKFGSITCIDDALDKIASRGYGYYYDDVYSNMQSIDRMKNGQGVNCTDSCQVFYNLGLYFVAKGKYKKVECLHIKCQGGDGHVRLRFTLPNNQTFYRDPACTLDNGGYCNWCMNGTLLAVNPNWFMQNLNR